MNRLFIIISVIVCLFCGNISIANEIAEKNLPYNYADTYSIPIYLKIVEPISTRHEQIIEGQIIKFAVQKDIYHNEELILKRGDIIDARVETIITSGMNGFPAEIIIDNFVIPGIKNTQLISEYTKKGQNRCFWVYPLKWSLTLIPFVGSLTNLIKGGHARITAKDDIILLYYPNWK